MNVYSFSFLLQFHIPLLGDALKIEVALSFCYILIQGGLPMYIATRGLYSLKPPTVFVPPCIKEDVEQLIDIHRSMGHVELNLDLVALDVGN